MKWSRTFEVISCQEQLYPQAVALKAYRGGMWKAYSSTQCQEEVNRYSQLLSHLGVRKGDRVMFVPDLATDEMLFLDLGIQQLGAISVPCHLTQTLPQFYLILHETEAEFCFFSAQESMNHFYDEDKASSCSFHFFRGDMAHPQSLDNLFEKQKDLPPVNLAELKAAVSEDDLAAIMYTSGTTGRPKGVMLSHRNVVSNIKSVLPLLPMEAGEKALSFLPCSHILERTILYAYLASGISIHLAEDRNQLEKILKLVKPHYFTAVPRILERMYDNVITFQLKQSWLKRRIMGWALQLGKNYREQAKLRPWYWMQAQLARMLVFNRFRRMIGGEVKAILTGAAYLRPEIGRIFAAAGIKVREGYGMTETSPVITFNQFSPGLNRFGTVGVPVPGVRIKIDQPDEEGEGEILVQGPNVMQGYYKLPEETAEVLDKEGWLRTGDVGKFVHKRFLRITDRKKDIFKTSSGKYISPMVLENHFLQSPYIEQIMITGFQQPFVTALIRPNFELLHLWCVEQQIHWTSPTYMVHNIKIRQKIQAELDPLNASLPSHEKLRDFHLFPEEWTVEKGQLTYTMKLVRSRIAEEYAKAIEAMYK